MTPERAINPEGSEKVQRVNRYPKGNLFKRLFQIELRAEAVVNLDDVVGEIDPRIFSQFIEDMDTCGRAGREQGGDVAELFQALQPAIIRFKVGAFDSDSAQAELKAFLFYCERVGAAPYLSLDPAAMTEDEAAKWVNALEPRKDLLWGLAAGQQDTSSAAAYVEAIKPFIAAMRAADPEIQLAVAGLAILPGDPEDAEAWNRTVLTALGDQVDYLAFSLYQPDEVGREEVLNAEQRHHSMLSAPHSAEEVIQRLGALVQELAPEREIGLVLDGFNVMPPTGDLHPAATLQDGLYIAGMLNVFQRQCEVLKVACLAQGAGQLPLIVKPEGKAAFATPLYFPYQLYRKMESQLLTLAYWSPVFQAQALGGNISERNQVPFIDITATRSPEGQRVVLGITNRSPLRKAKVMVNLKGEGNRKFRVAEARLMRGLDVLAANTVDAPEQVSARPTRAPKLRFAWLDIDLPPASLMVVVLEKKG
ncbi:hypothetical protein JR338_09965 [Chloroflexota bacterium]|nr:hypothetical protein JR338_09965 [Chloroflexota bacterium]